MSNIYIQEPPTNGKVLLETSVGDIDIELWSKEAPKACRNFVQLCMEGYYDETIFHRIVKGFICQGGDPTGTGMGGESVYGKPFKDEFHQRLRFNRRGLVAMANAGPNDNSSQFFFTLARADELHKKHTIFGKVSGNTIYNMIRLEEVEVDENDRPIDPPKIFKTEVLSNPFDDIEPRKRKEPKITKKEERPKSQSKATKNYKLLSFGEEAEEDEEETAAVSKTMKIQSSHDVLQDPHLSSDVAVEESAGHTRKEKTTSELIRDKLKKEKKRPADSVGETMEKGKEHKRSKKDIADPEVTSSKQEKQEPESEDQVRTTGNELLKTLREEKKEFMKKKKNEKALKKGQGRELETLSLLASFQDRLFQAQDEEKERDPKSSWMAHKLKFEDTAREAKDANIRNEDTFDIYDPRNPITKRRRETGKSSQKGKGET